ncbi:F-box/LRR-repeat protein 20-like [Bacillus rossius redtenbacheri]|uniref:F-box/LRR-repeat protein 20-like n=1 Tax=Bacillus rossius redtenbacheri TaxID=93214 RepID=UPI002FDCB6B1
MASVNSLPSEVLCIVFEYLSVDDLVHTIPSICQKWKNASQDILLWKNKTYRPTKDKTVEDVVSYLKKLPRLYLLDLKSMTDENYVLVDKILILICQMFPEVESVLLGDGALYSVEQMISLLHVSSSLNSLSLNVSENNHDLMRALWSAPKLKHLSLTNHPILDDISAEYICNIVRCCHSLEALKLTVCVNDMNKITRILEVAKHVLKYLEFKAVFGFQQALLSDSFVQCYKLKTLKFSTKEGQCELLNLANFGKMPSILELALINFPLVPSSLTLLFVQNSWPQLEVLCVSGVKTLETEFLHQVFERCPNLQSLDVSRSNISDTGISSLNVHCPKLQHLCVSYTSLTDLSLTDFWRCPLVDTLILRACCKLTSNVVHHIVKCVHLKLIDASNNTWLTDRDVVKLLSCSKLETLRIGSCESISGIFFQNVKCFSPTLREIELSQFVHEDYYKITCQKLHSLRVTTVDKYSEYRLSNDVFAYP